MTYISVNNYGNFLERVHPIDRSVNCRFVQVCYLRESPLTARGGSFTKDFFFPNSKLRPTLFVINWTSSIGYSKLLHIPTAPLWCHQMETFSMLLALYVGNSQVTGELLSQRPVTRSFDVFFDLRLNRWLSKQLRLWWFEMPLRSLWHHWNDCWWQFYIWKYFKRKFHIWRYMYLKK